MSFNFDEDALLAECTVETFRSSGPGGQNVNKVETAVRLIHHPSGVIINSQRHRSQYLNRKDAVEKLRKVLEERARPKKLRRESIPNRANKAERLRTKLSRAVVKKGRQKPTGDE
ncbi:MAG: peptide chain release factor-like protein [Candidatus Sumerlaeia bacterium]|nr:peptide chain release factor-like protein [Candidatus Sumerlaeia bacterium]